ncbi:MAG: YhbY family RNA-binding protein [Clostridia bacterium]|nr:YhbY family RNA-binding protein [Clostridia bacterium]
MTSKQRAALRGMANTMEPILFVGKGGLIDTLIKQADDALLARELVKGKLLETAPLSVRDAAARLADATGAAVVQVIGRTFVLYRRNEKKENGIRI